MATVHPGWSVPRVSAGVLSAGVVVSAVVNFAMLVGSDEYLRGARLTQGNGLEPIEIDDDVIVSPPVEQRLTLGRREASTASINWLGVVEDSQQGVGVESEIEQAQFVPQIGDASESAPAQASTQPSPTPPIQQPPEPQVAQESTDPSKATVQSPVVIDQPPDEPEPAPPERVEASEQDATVVIEPTPEPEQPEPLVPEPPAEEEIDTEKPAEPAQEPTSEPKEADRPEPPPESSAASVKEPGSDPKVAGEQGIVDERESAATMLREAVPVKQERLNRPLAAKGMEIITAEPKFPAATRFTQLPRNPVVVIRFDASGRVIRAKFLRDGKRIYDTGSRGVDEPLISAIYQWRAKGEPIENLTPGDPKSFIEISMRILFRK